MRIGKFEFKRRVLVGLVFALAATGVWWIWTRSRERAVVAVVAPKQPFVRLARTSGSAEDLILREQAEYFDPTPLFFPTEWNFGQKGLPESMRRQPGQVFGSFEEKFTFQDQGIKPYGAEAPALPEQLADMLNQGNDAPFAGMGQTGVPRPVLAERNGFLEIRGMHDGKIIVAQSLTGLAMPHADFVPLEFIAIVSSVGLVGEPVLVTGSGREEVDVFLRTYLAKTFHLGERLSPGLYRVLVGP
jgi:hypothetical protein